MLIFNSIQSVIGYLKANLDQTDITLNPGASEELISKFEKHNNLKLPDDFRQFYAFSNGFSSDEDMFTVVSLEDLKYHGDIYIAEYMIYCDSWELKINPNNQNDYTISCSNVLTNSFTEFLRRFLTGGVFNPGGLYHWEDEVKNRNK